MKKAILGQFVGVIAALASIILSLTVYAYRTDLNSLSEKDIKLEESIKTEIIDRKEEDTKLEESIKTELDKKVATEEFKQYKESIFMLLEYIKSSEKEKRELELKLIEFKNN